MFKAPNIKGPRFRKESKQVLNKALYDNFLKIHPQHQNVTYDQFSKVIKNCSNKMWRIAIDERDGIELLSGGSIFVGNTKIIVKNNYDIIASIKANAPIRHRNYDTDGYVAKIYYSPHLAKIAGRDRSMWSFKGHRDFKRTLSKEYAKDWKKYRMVEGLYAVAKEYNRAKNRHYYTASTEQAVKNYNEFDI